MFKTALDITIKEKGKDSLEVTQPADHMGHIFLSINRPQEAFMFFQLVLGSTIKNNG